MRWRRTRFVRGDGRRRGKGDDALHANGGGTSIQPQISAGKENIKGDDGALGDLAAIALFAGTFGLLAVLIRLFDEA